MSTQMTIRVDDALAMFVDEAVASGEGSRAQVIGRALQREIRRRTAQRDARIYTFMPNPAGDDDTYTLWASANAQRIWSEID